MKKYEKPMIRFESFSLRKTEAAGCGAATEGNSLGKPTQGDPNTCGQQVGDMVIWEEGEKSEC